MYKYETHLHTFPVSRCAVAGVRETLQFYKEMSYDGVFITNHFLDGNVNIDINMPYEKKINFYFSDYEEGVKIGKEIGIKVFCGVELSYYGTDFLIYGLDKAWYLKNPQLMDMKKTEELKFMMKSGALVIQAHPYREAEYIDHIRLFPRCVHGVEVINGCRTDFENHMAKLYAENYGLIESAGSDNHKAGNQKQLAGLSCDEPITDEHDFVNRMKNDQMKLFSFCIDDNK